MQATLPNNNLQENALALCKTLLQPIIKIAMNAGLKHSEIDNLIRHLMIEQAQAVTEDKNGKPNISNLATVTGLQRKDISERLKQAEQSNLPATGQSMTSQAFTLWCQWAKTTPMLTTLPIGTSQDPADYPSFANLAKQVTKGTLHHRSLLNDLVRLNMVSESEEKVSLIKEIFTPSQDQQLMMAFASDNGSAHLNAIAENIVSETPKFFEQAVFSENIAIEDCQHLATLTKTYWQQIQPLLLGMMTEAENKLSEDTTTLPTNSPQKIRIGMYLYHDDNFKENHEKDL